MPLGYTDEWSGVVKLTNTSLANAKLNYQAIFNHARGPRAANYAFRFNPDGLSTQQTFSISHGLDWTQTLGAATFLDLSLRQNYFDYKDYLYEDLYDPRYDEAAPQSSDVQLRAGRASIQGVGLQPLPAEDQHLHPQGLGGQPGRRRAPGQGRAWSSACPRSSSAPPGYLVFTIRGRRGTPTGAPRRRTARLSRASNTYYPVIGAAYIQDSMEWKDLIVRGGLRLDYFDARATMPSDLANPANAIEGARPPTRTYHHRQGLVVSPRSGWPIPSTDKAAVHFAYGHFHQFPPIGPDVLQLRLRHL